METSTTYKCEECGKVFEDEEECLSHEISHALKKVFESDAKFFDEDGKQMSYNKNMELSDFVNGVVGIVCNDVEIAHTIDMIYDTYDYYKPFEDYGYNPDVVHRIGYIKENDTWIDIDEEIANIKKLIGE